MGLYQIEAPMEQALAMAEVLVKSCEQLGEALEHLRGFKDLEHYWIEIHRLENDGRPALPRRGRVAVRQRDRPDGRDPLDGHLPRARAGRRRDRDRGAHPRGHRHQERSRSALGDRGRPDPRTSSSRRRSRSTSPTAFTTPPTSSRPRSRPARCRRASRSPTRRSSTSSARSSRSRSRPPSPRTSSTRAHHADGRSSPG